MKNKTIISHLLFWMIAFIVLFIHFSGYKEYAKVDFIYTSVFLFSLAIPVYLNRYINIPQVLNQRRYWLFGLIFILLVLVGALFNQIIFSQLIDYIFPGYYFISYYAYPEVVVFFLIFLLLTTLLKLSSDRFGQLEMHARLAQTEQEKSLAELNALKAQINPHFLFNSLNLIYSLVQKSPQKSADAIVQLSDILRFSIYEANEPKVSIHKEVALIEDYISLQQFRHEKELKVSFNKNIQHEAHIIPLLLLPLVENCFKHAEKDASGAFVHITLTVADQFIYFSTKNMTAQFDTDVRKNRGTGINNVKKRLEMLYPQNHKFEISTRNHTFITKIQLPHEIPMPDYR